MDKQYFVYLLTNKNNSVLYTGVTNNLERRVAEHKFMAKNGFTFRYNVNRLVYFETTNDIRSAIEREKQIKNYSRKRKNELVNGMNPDWKDLAEE